MDTMPSPEKFQSNTIMGTVSSARIMTKSPTVWLSSMSAYSHHHSQYGVMLLTQGTLQHGLA
jgi:hypothetical protein